MNIKYIKDVFTSELDNLIEQIRYCFTDSRGVDAATKYITGLLSPVERKNGWQLAEAMGDATPYAVQQFIYRGRWCPDVVMECGRDYIRCELGCDEAVLVVDDTGFPKKGTKSVGVARQYSGTLGKIDNCQIGVFLTYASAEGFAPIDRQIYLPKEWMDDADRCKAAGVPEDVEFTTKPQMALAMLKRSYADGRAYGMPFSWVTADSAYGDARDISMWLESIGKSYVLAVSGKAYVWSGIKQHRVSAILENLTSAGNDSSDSSDSDWHRISCGSGSKGEREYDWCLMELNPSPHEGFARYLLVRRSITDPTDLQAFICFCPIDTTFEKLVSIAGTRWQIEQNFEELKGEVGLDHYEVRSHDGWYRHITLALLAHMLLTVIKTNIQDDRGFQDAIEVSEVDTMEAFKKGRNL